jgi:hypothetical protein
MSIDTVCIFLGPLNNLTTLVATALAFHPEVQVLNHGARYLWESKGCNFLADFTEESFRHFVKEALFLSLSAGVCRYDGGSILTSHTFEGSQTLASRYIAQYGPNTLKEGARCLVWKDPMEVERYIEGLMIEYHELFRKDGDRLRFLLPIRNPMDTMISLSHSDHWKLFAELQANSANGILNCLLAMFERFLRLERQFPGRFFHFTQDEFAEPETLAALAEFLRLTPDEGWMETCKEIWQVRPPYQLDPLTRQIYVLVTKMKLSHFPEVAAKLITFADTLGTRPLPT